MHKSVADQKVNWLTGQNVSGLNSYHVSACAENVMVQRGFPQHCGTGYRDIFCNYFFVISSSFKTSLFTQQSVMVSLVEP